MFLSSNCGIWWEKEDNNQAIIYYEPIQKEPKLIKEITVKLWVYGS